MTRIYLDHNATTPVDPRVLERFVAVERACLGNPASAHGTGRRARAVVEEARARIAEEFAVEPDGVVFVSGGTEANNIVVLGCGDPTAKVAVSGAEHASVLEAARRRGAVELSVDGAARTCFDAAGVRDDVALLCAVYGQSEVGSLNDLHAARGIADALDVPLHVDASQALGRVDLGAALALADTLALSVHKAGGLRGGGLLIVRRHAERLRALGAGGTQERSLRPGTVSPALAAATAEAVVCAMREWPQRAAAMARARDALATELLARTGVQRVGAVDATLPNTVMLAFTSVADGRMLLPALDLEGIDASHGTACSSGSPQPPAVLLAMGYDHAMARRCVRFSTSHLTMIDAAQRAARIIGECIDRLQRTR